MSKYLLPKKHSRTKTAGLFDFLHKDKRDDHNRTMVGIGAGLLPAASLPSSVPRPPTHLNQPNIEALKALLRAGDVLVSGKRTDDVNRTIISLMSGQPSAYHSSVLTNPATLEGISSNSHDSIFRRKGIVNDSHHVYALRMKDPAAGQTMLRNVEQALANKVSLERDTYKRVSEALRQQNVPRDQIHEYAQQITRGFYDKGTATKAGLVELLGPKLSKNPGSINRVLREYQGATSNFIGGEAYNSILDHAVRMAEGSTAKATPLRAGVAKLQDMIPNCVGSHCSSIISKSLPEGMATVGNKLPHQVLPHDLLKSNLFEVIGTKVHRPTGLERLLKASPHMLRIAAGLGLAAAARKGYDMLTDS